MQFKVSKTVSREELTIQQLLQVVAVRKNKVREEIFVECGEKFIF